MIFRTNRPLHIVDEFYVKLIIPKGEIFGVQSQANDGTAMVRWKRKPYSTLTVKIHAATAI